MSANAGGSSGTSRVEAATAGAPGAISSSGVLGGAEKRPIRPKLLKLSDVTIPHRNRKKTKTKSKDRSGSSVRDRIYDDPAYTDDISHLAKPLRRSSVNIVNSDLLNVSGAIGSSKGNSGGSSSLGKRSKLTKQFQKLAQEDIGHIAFSSSEEDLRYQRASSSKSEGIGRGRSLERSNAVIGEQPEKQEIKRRPEKRSSKQKRNLSLDSKHQQSQQEMKERDDKVVDRPPEPPQRLALTRYNLGKQRSDEATWQRQQSQLDFPPAQQDNEDVFSLHSSVKENLSVAASTTASLSSASTSKIQMGKRFLKGEIGIKSFNYYLLKEGLKSSKKFVEKKKNNFQSSTNNTLATLASSTVEEITTPMPLGKNKFQANSEENIYEEIFFKDAPPSEEDDENQNPSNRNKQQGVPAVATAATEQNLMYADCELCMQQCDKADCEYCFQPELSGNLNQNRTMPPTINNPNVKTTSTGNRLNTGNLNNNTSSRSAIENQNNSAPILEFQSYNPNNPGVYKIETTPVAITGDYNPILQFQQPSAQTPQPQQHKHVHVHHQSTSTTSTATTTPSDYHLQHHHHSQLQQQQQQQSVPQQQQFYGYKHPTFYSPHTQSGFWSQTSSVPRPRAYMVAGHFPNSISSIQRMNTKSSSSSDSLQQQHKFNTFAHLDANFFNSSNVATIAGTSSVSNNYLPPQPLQPLMYAASRRLGGSQILVDNSSGIFENPPQIYKSDSRASILSEYSLSRSSDTYYGSHRYGHNRHYGASHRNDHHNFENSLMSSYATSSQRRYFGSAESCRFGYDCRRCSLDSGHGAGLLANPRVTQNNAGTSNAASEKCTFSDHCKYDCRNCDCSSVYFSSDFDEIYSGGGIPRKTAKGTLPSTGGQPPPPALENFDATTNSEKQQALKQNKYAQDFFKHVNDVKRSIYQAEMQRNGNMELMSPKKSLKKESRAKEVDKEILGVTTLPLAKELSAKPTPAPRTSLHQQPQNPGQTTPQPLQRRLPAKYNEPCVGVEKKEYASLDRLIASNKGAIPKNTNNINRLSPHSSPKLRTNTIPPREAFEVKTNEQQYALPQVSVNEDKRHVKKHSRETSKITSSSLAVALSGHRRKDIPAPPPPSPATYADLQELQQNLQDTMRDDTKQDRDRKRKRKQHESGEHGKQQRESSTTITKDDEQQQSTEVSLQPQQTDTETTTNYSKTIEQHKVANNVESNLTTKDSTDNTNESASNIVTESKANTTKGSPHNTTKICIPGELQANNLKTNEENSLTKSSLEKATEEETTLSTPYAAQTQTSSSSMPLVSLTSVSSSIVTAMDFQQRDQTETYDDDVFYDARSEDSACTAASSSMASNSQLKQEQLSCAETKCQQSEQVQKHLQQQQNERQQQGLETFKEEFLKNQPLHQQDTNDDDEQQQKNRDLKNKGKTENEQQQPHCQPQPSPSDSHKVNEALQQVQQMNKNEVKKKNNNIKDVNHLQCGDNVVRADIQTETQQQFTDNSITCTGTATNICTAEIKTTADGATTITTPTSSTADTKTDVSVVGPITDSALELKVNKQSKEKQEVNEYENKNELKTKNNEDGNFITKDNDKPNKSDKRETKRIGKHKRDYIHEEERREHRLRNNQQQHQPTEDGKPTTTVITAKTSATIPTSSVTKKQRSQRRSPSSSYNSNQNVGGGQKLPTSTLSCDTCCQLEWSQQDFYNNSQHQQQHSPQTLKPPTLHIGMAGQPARVSKRKTSSSSSMSRERANKTKEIKTKIIYSQEKPESTTKKLSTTTRETAISTTTVTNINKPKETEKETDVEIETKPKPKTDAEIEQEKQTATCSAPIKSTNVAETKANEEQAQEQLVKKDLIKESNNENANILDTTEQFKENSDILLEIKEISKAIASLQHDAETSDSITLEAEPYVAEMKNVDNIEDKPVSIKITTATTSDDAAAATADDDTKEETNTLMMDQHTAKETVDVDADADVAAAATTVAPTTATANDSKTNTTRTNISCNSEFAGVTTHSPHNSSSAIVPLITTVQSSLSQESDTRRPPLQRQDYSCFDSSEAQSDDSHLTRDSVTRESQNDELSSSTLDKIDVSSLPLPALPPKKRRTKLRASPSKHHHCRGRHESPQKHQQELRDPHGSQESSQLNTEDNKHLSAFQQYVAKRRESLEASSRSFNEKLESRRMHYHMGGGGGAGPASNSSTSGGAGIHMPTYLFGEQYYTGLTAGSHRKSMGPSSKEEIYLNKSGWVQVHTKRANDENRGYRRANYSHQNGDLRNTIRVIQIDNTKRSNMARQALLQHQHSMMEQPKFVSSKVEELIQRNESRLGSANGRDSALRPGYRIVDPQLASILNERPGFLPVKNLNDRSSPPPITPILSPPPAFQDSSAKIKSFDRRRIISTRPSPQHHILQPHAVLNDSNLQATTDANNKGMVFSRSFEYDNRRPTPTDAYVETFSRSFDGNLTERVAPAPLPRDRSPNFSTLTGNSPNYLTKKDSGGGSSSSLKSRDSSPKYQSPVASISSVQSPQNQKTTAYLNTSVKEAPPSYSVAGHQAQKYSPRSAHHDRSFERSKSHNVLGRSRKSQFSRSGSGSTGVMVNNMGVSRFRSFDTTASQRLNSCDSGARSDLSNDELDIEEDDAGSSEFLNTNSYHPATSPFKTQRQRSLTPDRNESHSSSSSVRKQRSITPESRSLTPEDRRKKGSQVSLSGSRQNSSSRSNTLERKHDKANISRSSSSSSYSGREHDSHGHSGGVVGNSGVGVMEGSGMRVGVTASNLHRRSLGRNAKQTDEHRIRRSRSLQLTERSPNRGHKMVVCVGQSHTNTNQPPLYQQSNMRNNFPPTIRTSGKSQSILITNTNGGVTGPSTRHRQSDIDKSRSFDFDYCNYNAHGNSIKSQHSSQNLLNREAALRLEFDKSRSFDEDYREAIGANNNLNANAMRYLQANDSSERNRAARIRRSSPVEGNGRNTRSPQSSGSSCNNLSVPRSTTSPQNYGTRLCDHEMTYDLMRKSLDRSPIMDFRRGDSGDYDIPMSMLRNRETINSGGNSELNFMNSDNRQYKHLSANSLKQQRSLRRTQSPNETHYSLERAHTAGSRDDITPIDPNEYRNEYNDIYRRTRSSNRGSDLFKSKPKNVPLITTTTTITTTPLTSQQQQQPKLLENCSNEPCSYWPQCGACQNLQQPNYEYLKSLPLKRKKSHNLFHHNAEEAKSNNTKDEAYNSKSLMQLNAHVSTVKININTSPTQQNNQENAVLLGQQTAQPRTMSRPPKSTSQWTLLCKNALASKTTTTTINSNQNVTCLEPTAATCANNVVNVKCFPLLPTTKLTETMAAVTATTATTTTPNVKISTSTLTTALSPSAASSSSSSSLSSTPNTTTVSFHQQPRVIPLAATSLVFLGDFEMPITRDCNNCNAMYETKAASPSSSSAGVLTSSAAKTAGNNLHDNLKRLYTNTITNGIQTRKYYRNKFKDKTSNTMMMNKIMENDVKGSSGTGSCSSSCNESSILSSCGSGNNCRCNSSKTTTTTAYADNYRKRKNLKIKSIKTQRCRRRPRMSLPNIWLNLAEEEQQDDGDVSKQRR